MDEAGVFSPDGCTVEPYTGLGRDGRLTRCPGALYYTILDGDLRIWFGAATSDEALGTSLLSTILDRLGQ